MLNQISSLSDQCYHKVVALVCFLLFSRGVAAVVDVVEGTADHEQSLSRPRRTCTTVRVTLAARWSGHLTLAGRRPSPLGLFSSTLGGL